MRSDCLTLASTGLVVAGLLVGCHDAPGRAVGESSTGTATTGEFSGSSAAPTSDPAPTGSSSGTSTGEIVGPTTGTTTDALTTDVTTGSLTTDTGSSDEGTTAAPVPAFDELPWLTGDDIGYGIAYKDSQDPDAHNVFIGYAGYPFPLDAAQSWATALYHARLRELGVRHVYAVQGPSKVMYSDYEIGNTSIAAALTTRAAGAAFVLVAGHSSGSYVAHELLGQLAGDYDPGDVTKDRVVYFNLDGGTAGLSTSIVDRLRRAYFVGVHDSETGTDSPNLDAMKYLGEQWPARGSYLEVDGAGAGCNAGAPWCLHMRVINSSPHDPSDSSVTDYYDFVGRPVVTSYIDVKADEAGLHP